MNLSLDEYVNNHINLVKKLISFYIKVVGNNFDIDDLYQTGLLGLVESYYSYDSSKGAMSTHAYYCIKYSILNYISNNSFATYIPANLICYVRVAYNENVKHLLCDNRYVKLNELRDALKNKNMIDCNLSDKFLSDLIKISVFHIKGNILSYEMLADIDNDEIIEKYDSLFSDDNVEEQAVNNFMVAQVLEFIEQLPNVEKTIIKSYFGLGSDEKSSYRKIASQIGFSYQYVAIKCNKVMKKIKEKFNI